MGACLVGWCLSRVYVLIRTSAERARGALKFVCLVFASWGEYMQCVGRK